MTQTVSTLVSVLQDETNRYKAEFGLDCMEVTTDPLKAELRIAIARDTYYTWTTVSFSALCGITLCGAMSLLDYEIRELCRNHDAQVTDLIFDEAEEGLWA